MYGRGGSPAVPGRLGSTCARSTVAQPKVHNPRAERCIALDTTTLEPRGKEQGPALPRGRPRGPPCPSRGGS